MSCPCGDGEHTRQQQHGPGCVHSLLHCLRNAVSPTMEPYVASRSTTTIVLSLHSGGGCPSTLFDLVVEFGLEHILLIADMRSSHKSDFRRRAIRLTRRRYLDRLRLAERHNIPRTSARTSRRALSFAGPTAPRCSPAASDETVVMRCT